ncbi:hypothetical protein [Pediococcus argentinicus]|uniref:Uncharacterized protein n=1 Tax=Pediococcus argentinicus TaxID=480391 RepID=A0A0R2NPQ7_9LACO|nr:hypothetical protein [Pediococcus argentinicus]KRO25997.1 hypothetical protein IV88_GL001265 [Pediococcus argentinicus]NKZ21753.1 hypothetical protein [Pediococcus argentinicus]GEP18990.1 hypothetical protein LSA03_03740 [Pediococcus argentinicus]
MNKINKLIQILKRDNRNEFWKIDSEDGFSIFVYDITTTLDIFNTLGGLSIKYSLSYPVDKNDNLSELSKIADSFVEIEIQSIPDEILNF